MHALLKTTYNLKQRKNNSQVFQLFLPYSSFIAPTKKCLVKESLAKGCGTLKNWVLMSKKTESLMKETQVWPLEKVQRQIWENTTVLSFWNLISYSPNRRISPNAIAWAPTDTPFSPLHPFQEMRFLDAQGT